MIVIFFIAAIRVHTFSWLESTFKREFMWFADVLQVSFCLFVAWRFSIWTAYVRMHSWFIAGIGALRVVIAENYQVLGVVVLRFLLFLRIARNRCYLLMFVVGS